MYLQTYSTGAQGLRTLLEGGLSAQSAAFDTDQDGAGEEERV